MDADGLPIVGPGIDLRKVDALHQKRTLAFLNHFVTHTACFLNQFSCVCEEKLAQLAVRINRLDTTVSILEAKLSSIPGLENVTVTTNKGEKKEEQKVLDESENEKAPVQMKITDKEVLVDDAARNDEQKPQTSVSQDPRYSKFFKMLQVGVPPVAVKQKMTQEGYNPDILDDPNAAASEHSQSDPEFSDEEDVLSDDSDAGFSDS